MKRVLSLLIRPETVTNVSRLKAMGKKSDSLAVIMSGSPDPDAMASAMALYEIIRQTSGLRKCVFASTDTFIREQNFEFARAMKIEIKRLAETTIGDYSLVALVDAQPSFFGDGRTDSIQPQIVLDHHPRTGTWHAELEDIRESYGSLSTVMTEYLLAAKVKIPRILYTALLYGIKSDTNNLERDVLLEDIGAYYFNFARANRQLIRRIEMNQIPERYLKYYEHAYRHRRRYRERMTCFLGRVESADVCVQVADFYLRIINIYYVVIAGIFKDRLIIVFRGDGYRQDCGAIAKKAFGKFGSAGGHKSAARVEIPLTALKEIVPEDFSQEATDHFLAQQLRREKPAPKPNAGNSKTVIR